MQTDERVPPRGFQKAVHPPSRWIEEGTGREEGWEEEEGGGCLLFQRFQTYLRMKRMLTWRLALLSVTGNGKDIEG